MFISFNFVNQIVSLLDVFPDMTGLSLVFEFMPHTLLSKLKESMSLSRATIRSYTKMLLNGVKHMHSIHIMHRVRMKLMFALRNNATNYNELLSIFEGYKTSQSAY